MHGPNVTAGKRKALSDMLRALGELGVSRRQVSATTVHRLTSFFN